MLGVSQEPTYANRSGYKDPPTWADVVFDCMFGPDVPVPSTTAIDTSPVANTITFHGNAQIVNMIPIVGTRGFLNWPDALQCTTADGDYVSAPHVSQYDLIGQGDLTIEFWLNTSSTIPYNPNGPQQWLGVWQDPPLLANQHWRFVTDRDAWHFQWIESGVPREAKLPILSAQTAHRWIRFVIERYLTQINIWWQGDTDFVALLANGDSLGKWTAPTNPVPLTIGGTPTLTTFGWMRGVRITNGAWYRGQTPTHVISPPGWLFPSLVVDTDVHIRPMFAFRTGQTFAPLIPADDVIYPANVAIDQVIRPQHIGQVPGAGPGSLHGQLLDRFFEQTVPNYGTGILQGWPGVIATDNLPPYPVFEDETVSSGSGTSATLTLPATRNTGDVMIAVIQISTILNGGGGEVFSMSNGDASGGGPPLSGANWYFDYANFFPQSYVNNFVAIAARTVDGAETAPQFSWPHSANWHGRILRFSNCNTGFFQPSLWSFVTSQFNPILSYGGFNNQSDLLWDGHDEPVLYVQLMFVNLDMVIPNTAGALGGYTRILSQANTADGSVLIRCRNGSAPGAGFADHWGSGYVQEIISNTGDPIYTTIVLSLTGTLP